MSVLKKEGKRLGLGFATCHCFMLSDAAFDDFQHCLQSMFSHYINNNGIEHMVENNSHVFVLEH